MSNFLKDFFVISHIQSCAALFILIIIFISIRSFQKRDFNFSFLMFISLFVGIIFGFVCKFYAGQLNADLASLKLERTWLYEVSVWLKFIETIFISLLRLLIIPMVFVGIINVVINIEKHIKAGAILTRAMFWLMITTSISAFIGVMLGYFANIGIGMNIVSDGNNKIREMLSINEIFLGLMPNNIITAMNTNNILGIVLFAFLIAFAARHVGKEKNHEEGFLIFIKLINFLYQVVMKLAYLIIYMMPYAIVVMIANIIISSGIDAIINASNFIFLTYIAALFVFLMHITIIFIHGLNPFIYIKKTIPVLIMAFTSRSSLGTLPVTISVLVKKLGVNNSIANCVASLGSTIGMNGCAGYFAGLTAVLIYNTLGLSININDIILIVVLCLIASFGIAGIPGTTTMIITVILTGLGLESHFALLAIILAIDPIIDMVRTLSNVSGAMVASIATSKELDSIDMEIYNK